MLSAAPETVEITTPDAQFTARERLETELAYLEPEAMANPADYKQVRAELEAELAALEDTE